MRRSTPETVALVAKKIKEILDAMVEVCERSTILSAMNFLHANLIQRNVRNLLTLPSLARLMLYTGVWLILTEGISGSWLIGLPVIFLIVILRDDDKRDGHHPPVSLRGSAAFLPFFLWQSIVSGFDVARRALRSDMQLHPALLVYPLNFPEGAARRLFINTITLMPGTLSVEDQGDTLLVHVLDERQPVITALQRLEARVGALFPMTQEKMETAR